MTKRVQSIKAPSEEKAGDRVDPFPWSSWRSLYPFQSHYLRLDGGVRMHYVDEGAGKTVLMVHGNPTWSFYYRRLIASLRRKHRCVAPDHVGCGLSDKPAGYPYCLERHVENLERLVIDRDLRDITLACHDWGGAIGMGMALRQRDRISRIVVMNTAAFPSNRIPLRISVCRLPVLGPIALRGFNLFSRAALHMAVARHERMTPATVRGYLYPYNNWRNRVAILRFVQDIPMRPGHPSYPVLENIGRGLEALRETPMLICWGERDFCFTTDFLAEWRERFPHAEVHSFPGAGHYVLEDAHEDIIPRIQAFLERCPAGSD